MRIFAFTAGAASMYCGSCLRDNALAAELKRRGHDVLLLPVYTPTLVDEANVSEDRVFFGGISVYLQQQSRLFRKTPWLVDKLWDSKLALKAAAKRSIPVNPKFLGEMTVAMLKGEQGPQQKEFEKMVHHLAPLGKPDVVTIPNSLVISMVAPLKRALGCPVYVTLQGEDLFLENLHEPYRSDALARIRAMVADADGFIAVSEFGARLMSSYLGIPKEKMHVIPLGVNPGDLTMKPAEREPGPFRIGYFARIAPEKSLHQLCEAYRWMRHEGGLPESRLEAAGYLAAEYKEYLQIIERQMKEWGLGNEFHYHGSPDRAEKIRFLHRMDVISVPSLYAEVKGLYALEAMACGVPMVSPRHGTFPEMLERTGGGVLAEPDQPESFGREILRLHRDAELRSELGRRGFQGVREHYTVEAMGRRALEVYSGNVAVPA